MNPREERGLVIAALCELKDDNGQWVVPSQSGVERLYRVNLCVLIQEQHELGIEAVVWKEMPKGEPAALAV